MQLAYAIGVAEPVACMVDTFGTAKVDEEKIIRLVREMFPLTPRASSSTRPARPIYSETAAYGHFGRSEPEFTWEKTDKAATLKKAAAVTAAV